MSDHDGTSSRIDLYRCFEKHQNVEEPRKCAYPKRVENSSPLFLENVLDIASTLLEVMLICGIEEWNPQYTRDTIVNAFLHYDHICSSPDYKVRMQIRKKELFHVLTKKCLMSHEEAQLAYMIIKRGFQAFHHQQPKEESCTTKPSLPDECHYVHAAKRTAQVVAHYNDLSYEEQSCLECNVKRTYEIFYNRMQERVKNVAQRERCNFTICGKEVESEPPTEEDSLPCKQNNKPTNVRCPKCCKLKKPKIVKRKIKPPKPAIEPPKAPFKLETVKSIWERPDMHAYYRETIANDSQSVVDRCKHWADPSWLRPGCTPPAEVYCEDWFDPRFLIRIDNCVEWPDPRWLKRMAGKGLTTEAACDDWFDPDFLKHFARKI